MKNLFTAVAICTLAALSVSPGLVRASGSTTYEITASYWKFTPRVITAHVGDATTLHLTSKEGVHSIGSTELGIPQTMLMPGKSVTVTFTPKKAGTYELHCGIPCGPGHSGMVLVIKVV